jgi:CRP/FNR family cyclic AMP-dependent transcriptional regulator
MAKDSDEHLRKVPLFTDFSRDDFEHIHSVATELQVAAGQVLMSEGETGHEMVVVLDGALEVRRDGVHVADIGPGGFVGEMALLLHRQRNSTVVASADSTVLQIDGRGFDALLESVPQLAVKMLPVVAARVAATNND